MGKQDNFQEFVTDIADAFRIRYENEENYDPKKYCTYIKELSGLTTNNNDVTLEIVLDVKSTETATKLFYNLYGYSDIYVDDNLMENPTNTYTFDTLGIHYVNIYGISEIPTYAFMGCQDVIAVSVPSSVKRVGDYAFYQTDIQVIMLSEGVEYVGQYTFAYCSKLEKVEISKTVTQIGKSTFYYCSNLKTIICYGETAPAFVDQYGSMWLGKGGTLYHPVGSDYSSWNVLRDSYEWTFEEFDADDSDGNGNGGSGIHANIESVQQFVTHIADTIRTVKRMNGTYSINPQNFYYHILTINLKYVDGRMARCGDIVIYNKIRGKVYIISQSYYRPELFPSMFYSPVGIVAIPYNQSTDGKIRVISYKAMDPRQDSNDAFSGPGIEWGPDGAINGLTSLNYYRTSTHPFARTTTHTFNTITMSNTTNNNFDPDVDSYAVLGHIGEPYGKWMTTTKVTTTPSVYYWSGALASRLCPLPYLEDEITKSDAYRYGALADMDGRGNTDKILAARGEKDYSTWKPDITVVSDYPAVSACDIYSTDGTKQGDWYLPSIGELGYVGVYISRINEGIKKLGGINFNQDYYYMWSSTSVNDNRHWALDTAVGGLASIYNSYGDSAGVYAFTSFHPDDVTYHGEHSIVGGDIEEEIVTD